MDQEAAAKASRAHAPASQQQIRAKLEQYASNGASGITNNNIVFETKIKIIDILQVHFSSFTPSPG